MIRLTRLDGREFIINAELIEGFEATPETVIALTIDKRIIVKESVDEVLEQIIHYKRLVFSEWPIKKNLRLPTSDNMFDWIEEDGLIETKKLDPEKLTEHQNAFEQSLAADRIKEEGD